MKCGNILFPTRKLPSWELWDGLQKARLLDRLCLATEITLVYGCTVRDPQVSPGRDELSRVT